MLVPAKAEAPVPNEEPRIAFMEDIGLHTVEEDTVVPIVSMAYVQGLHNIAFTPLSSASGDRWSCLISVQRWRKDFPRGVGFPNNVKPNTTEPSYGAVVLTTESLPGTETGHGGQVTWYSSLFVTFRECNYIPGFCGERTLLRSDSKIRGYWD